MSTLMAMSGQKRLQYLKRSVTASVAPEPSPSTPAWLGQGMDTWIDPVFQGLLVRGFTWAAGR